MQNSENFETCKRIGDEIAEIVAGNCYRCPKCGEIIKWDDDQYDDEQAEYTCPECGEKFPEHELEPIGVYDYLSDAFDIEYRIGSDRAYRSVRIMVACGGPNIYVDTGLDAVELYWGADHESCLLPSGVKSEIDDEFEYIYKYE